MSSNFINICIFCLKVYYELISMRQNAVCFSTEQFISSNIKKILLAILLVFLWQFLRNCKFHLSVRDCVLENEYCTVCTSPMSI